VAEYLVVFGHVGFFHSSWQHGRLPRSGMH
jgi:hypothetical protein